ncbi:ABC transporter permease [Gracilibacillus caseinilyticus]|uniref:ABC transporter permease n=1 Tax=Gracilibacillus caseinilyticus TaxID=2932256 RepID=A0ABY4EWV7_9BACI|nr:ABC transporter permease [Gracilibacillus caseinilyticus]UOQ48910.1 ABC transporter permease [Gracilibacillus caseinilyticus]
MNVMAVAKRIFQQFIRDKRSLALLLLAPILVLTLIWLVLDSDDYQPNIATQDLPEQIEQALNDAFDKEIDHLSKEETEEAFQDGEYDAFITVEDNQLAILLEGSDPTANSTTLQTIQEVLQSLQTDNNRHMSVDYFYGSDELNLFDQVGSVLIGFFIFFFVFIIGGISFLRERTQGTLEKLLSTPVKRWEIVIGYLLGFGLFTIIQSFIIVSYAVYLLDIWMAGDFWQLIIVTILLAITALSLATLLSAFANNEFQIMQFIPVVIVPQIFFSGIFQMETLPDWLQVVSKVMPLTYGADAMKAIMIKGWDIWDIWFDIAVIISFAIVFVILNIVALRKHRKL